MRVHLVRELFGDAGNADVPGDVAGELALGHAEIAERTRNDSPVVIAGEEEGRGARLVKFEHRRNVCLRQE
jgi:hypothetical protein